MVGYKCIFQALGNVLFRGGSQHDRAGLNATGVDVKYGVRFILLCYRVSSYSVAFNDFDDFWHS